MKNKGQSTVEYILLVTAVIGVIIMFTYGDHSPFKEKLNSTINMTVDGMQNMAAKLTNMSNGL